MNLPYELIIGIYDKLTYYNKKLLLTLQDREIELESYEYKKE